MHRARVQGLFAVIRSVVVLGAAFEQEGPGQRQRRSERQHREAFECVHKSGFHGFRSSVPTRGSSIAIARR